MEAASAQPASSVPKLTEASPLSGLPTVPASLTLQSVAPQSAAGPSGSVFGELSAQPGTGVGSVGIGSGGANRFSTNTNQNLSRRFDVGVDFYSPPDFKDGLIVFGKDVALKIGGYVKADFIYDFNPIDATDLFDTTTIPVGAAPRTNSRFHARQSRLSFDTRWEADDRSVHIFVEGDFFSEGDRFRLRHAVADVGPLMVGQTWTTFTDVAAAPATLDFEGSVSAVNRRQAQARWTTGLFENEVTWAVAIEDTRIILELPPNVTDVSTRKVSPDFVSHLRWSKDWGQLQVAGIYRLIGGQKEGQPVESFDAWGLNFSSAILVTENDKVYSQIVFGEGIGSYRGLPDAAPASPTTVDRLGLFGWMIGTTHNWNQRLSSNLTFAENILATTDFQDPNGVRKVTYLAVNLIWNPVDRVRVGAEYLYGARENIDRLSAGANRVQTAFIFDLP